MYMAKTIEELLKEISTGEHPSKIKLDIYRQVTEHLKECEYCQQRLKVIESGFDADKYPEDTLSTLDPAFGEGIMPKNELLPSIVPSCETCTTNRSDPDEADDCGDCESSNLGLWMPKDKTLCEGCPMWGKLVNYPYNDGWKCTKHAEPCWRNANFYD